MKKFIVPALLVVFFILFASPNTSMAKQPFRKMALEAKGAEKNKAAEINNDGIKHFSSKHWTESAEFFEDALKIDPNLAEAHFNLGLVKHKKNKHKEASDHFKKAAELAPDDQRIRDSEILKNHIHHKKGMEQDHKGHMTSEPEQKQMHESQHKH